MPIYEYRAKDTNDAKCCEYCRDSFEIFQKTTEPVTICPQCKNPVTKLISSFAVTYGMDYRAKGTGLSKLVRRDKGTYEKMY